MTEPTSPSDALASEQPLKHAVRRGAGAMAGVQMVSQVVSLVGVAILMRLLEPGDYGLVGMVLPIMLFLRIFATLGLNIATIQRPDLEDRQLSTLFWCNLGLGVVTTAVTALIAPAVGWLYARPELSESLRDITLALSATSLVVAVGAQHQALLERHLRLPRLGVIRVLAQLAATASGIAAAWAGWGVWALVVLHYVDALVVAALAWWHESWRPGWPTAGASARPLVEMGGLFALSAVVLFLADNLDRLLVGRIAGNHAVGLYSQAYNLMIKPVYLLTTPLTALLLSSLSRASAIPRAQGELLVAYYRLAAVVLLPCSVGLAVVGSDVMRLFGGQKWDEAGPLLTALSVGMFAQAVLILNGYVLTAAGRTGRLLLSSLCIAAVLLSGYLAGAWWATTWGAPAALGVACGYAVSVLGVLLIPHTVFCVRSAKHSAGEVLATWRRPLQAALVMGAMVWMFGEWLAVTSAPLRLIVLIPLGALLYAALAREELAWLAAHVAQWRRDRETIDENGGSAA